MMILEAKAIPRLTRCLVIRGCLILLTWPSFGFVIGNSCRGDLIIDSLSETDPKISLPEPTLLLSPQLKNLWIKALLQPEADLQRKVAESITRAHNEGVRDLDDMTDPLMAVLKTSDLHPIVRRAVAQALLTLDASQSAPAMFKHLRGEGLAYAQVVEPALARWNYAPIRKVWFERLSEPSTRRGLLLLAIRGARSLDGKASSSIAALWRLAEAPEWSPQVRLEAARALAVIQTVGLVDRARRLAAAGGSSQQTLVNRLVAASVLGRHSDDSSRELLLELAVDSEPAVATIALRRLLEIAPLSVVAIGGRLHSCRDAGVRLHVVHALAAKPDNDSIQLLGPLLDDPHPQVRTAARSALAQQITTPDVRVAVFDEMSRMLQGSSWRGQEQAALLSGSLSRSSTNNRVWRFDHKPLAKRLLELVDSERSEVATASSWALRKLAIPETLPVLLDKATRATRTSPRNEAQLQQLIQTFGQMNYKAAVPLLWKYIPKNSYGWESRVSAIWALGYIVTAERQSELVGLLIQRLSDLNLLDPEAEQVRQMAAISLGRLKDQAALAHLHRFYQSESPDTAVWLACRWAVQHMTGESLPGPQPATVYKRGWFLEPLKTSQ